MNFKFIPVSFFVKIKHWQLFLLVILPVLLPTFIGIQTPYYFISFAVTMIFFIVVLCGWLYSMGVMLHPKLPSDVKLNVRKFKAFLLIAVAYMILVSVMMLGVATGIVKPQGVMPALFLIIIPLHLFSMFAMFYSLYFVAKELTASEKQAPADFVGEFFLLWFFPIGVWIIQPRVNRLFLAS